MRKILSFRFLARVLRKLINSGLNLALFNLVLTLLFWLSINNCQALSLKEAIDLANNQSAALKIAQKKSELTDLGKSDAVSMFLPNLSAGYRNGQRKTSISGIDNKLKEDNRSLTLAQPIFNGFQGIAKIKESDHRSNAAKEDFQSKRNDIALEVTQNYLGILKNSQITAIEDEQIANYAKVLQLLNQRLSLKDISYAEYNDYETKAQNLIFKAEENKSALREHKIRFENLVKNPAHDLSDPIITDDLENIEQLLALAKQHNPKIKSSEHNLKAARMAIIGEKGKLLPKASVYLQHEDQKSSYYFGGSAIKNDAVYLDVTIPIFQSGLEYSAISKANKQQQIAELENRLANEDSQNQIRAAYQQFIALKQSLGNFEQALENSSKSLKLTEERFNKKDLGQIELLLKKIDVAEIKKQTLIIKYDMLLSYFRLKAVINQII